MKRLHTMAFFGLLSVAGSVAMASSGALSPFKPGLLPVLVQVDAHGKITEISPAIELSPQIKRLLAQNLGEMITKPAFDHGKPISSQFVVNLALQTTPLEGGNYDAQFAYVSTAPVPAGSWHWVDVEGRRFALAGPHFNSPAHMPFNDSRPAGYQISSPAQNSYHMSSPPTQSAPSASPVSAPAHSR